MSEVPHQCKEDVEVYLSFTYIDGSFEKREVVNHSVERGLGLLCEGIFISFN